MQLISKPYSYAEYLVLSKSSEKESYVKSMHETFLKST